jgi:hypothetical protein
MSETSRPLARTEDLLIERLDDELLVYDQRTDIAHALDPSAVKLWEACNGERSIEELASLTGLSRDDVRDGLEVFEARELLVTPDTEESISRRAVVGRGLAAAGALGFGGVVVHSVAAPTPAAAASCTATGQPCNLDNPGACCSQTCCNFGGGNGPTCCSLFDADRAKIVTRAH